MAKQLYEVDEVMLSMLTDKEQRAVELCLTPVADPTGRIVAWLRSEMVNNKMLNYRLAGDVVEIIADSIESGEYLNEDGDAHQKD